MRKIKVLIIEDEIPAQRLLKDMLAELDYEIEVVGCLNSIKSSLEWIKNNPQPELVLMDIQLSDGISFDILEQVSIDSMIIFTTAYDEYAIQAFKVNSLDYLLKPIDKDELKAAFEKYEQYIKKFITHKNVEIDYTEVASIIKKVEPNYRKHFLIEAHDYFFQLPVEQIAYFLILQKITFAVTFDKKKYPINFSLQKLKEQLNPDLFFKVNRQLIINNKAIKKVHSFFQGKLVIDVKPDHSEKIIVGKDKASAFKQWLDK
ncbi:two-component system response regulator [Candidatus Magnetomorum sp. HK-1]|nr:two-component system response regulator [Candidatus Magnetomorum sp. HK-1]